MARIDDDFVDIGELAIQIWGKPNDSLSSRNILRFGRKGSMSVDLIKNVWFDHENDEGGGWVDLYRLAYGRDPGRRIIRSDDAADDPAQRSEVARRIWDECQSAAGTLVERYLRARSIPMPPPDDLRYHRKLYHKPSGTHWPAMVAAVRDSTGQIVAVMRTWLHHINPGKAPVDPAKMSFGPAKGCAIQLAPPGPVLVIAEGIETALSVAYETGLPAWSAIFAGNMRTVTLPTIVREVVIAADGDDAGEIAAARAGLRWARLGLKARVMRPPPGFDFNDVLRGK